MMLNFSVGTIAWSSNIWLAKVKYAHDAGCLMFTAGSKFSLYARGVDYIAHPHGSTTNQLSSAIKSNLSFSLHAILYSTCRSIQWNYLGYYYCYHYSPLEKVAKVNRKIYAKARRDLSRWTYLHCYELMALHMFELYPLHHNPFHYDPGQRISLTTIHAKLENSQNS